MKKIRYFVLAILLVAAVYVWALVFGSTEAKLLEVDFFDVGQGDSIHKFAFEVQHLIIRIYEVQSLQQGSEKRALDPIEEGLFSKRYS